MRQIHDYRSVVLKKPQERRKGGSYRKELSGWKDDHRVGQKFLDSFSGLVFFISMTLAAYLVISELFLGGSLIKIQILGPIVLLLPMIYVFSLLIYNLRIKVCAKKYKLDRKKMGINEFVSMSSKLRELKSDFVDSCRRILGHIYCVDPAYIYPDDTPEAMRGFGVIVEPYGFEVVMGIAEKLNVELPDGEIFPMVKKVREKANNVEELICVLNGEFGKYLKPDIASKI